MNFLSLYGIIHSLYTPTHTRLSDIIRFIVNHKKKKKNKISIDRFLLRSHNTQRPTDPFLSLLHGISIKNLTIAQTSKNAGFWSIRSARIRIAVHSVSEVVFDQGYPSTTAVQKREHSFVTRSNEPFGARCNTYVYIRKTRFSRLLAKRFVRENDTIANLTRRVHVCSKDVLNYINYIMESKGRKKRKEKNGTTQNKNQLDDTII